MRTKAVLIVAAAAIVAAAGALVVVSLREPTVAMYPPTPLAPRDAGHALVGPILYTVDATRPEQWRYFAFRMGSAIENPASREWDLAFRRYEIIANGGPAFAGAAGVLDLGEVPFAAVRIVPEAGYQVTEGGVDPRNPALARWYRYGYFSHLLEAPATRLGRAHGGWPVREARDHQLLLSALPARVRHLPLRLSGRRLAERRSREAARAAASGVGVHWPSAP